MPEAFAYACYRRSKKRRPGEKLTPSRNGLQADRRGHELSPATPQHTALGLPITASTTMAKPGAPRRYTAGPQVGCRPPDFRWPPLHIARRPSAQGLP